MLLKGICTKCGIEIHLDIGNINNIEDAREYARVALEKMHGFSCPGHHVELSSPYPRYWNVDEWDLIDGHAPSEAEFLAQLKHEYKEVLTTDEMFKRDIITGFAYGLPITNDGLAWNFTHSPCGIRYYYH